MGKEKAKEAVSKKGVAVGDAVTVTGGFNKGAAGTVEHIRQATKSATVRLAAGGNPVSVPLSDLAAA